jgi:hypothetical protein
LLDSPRHDPHPEDAHLAAPTMGRCPICRAELSLFDLRDQKSGEIVYSKDFDIPQSPLAGCVYVQHYRGLGDLIGHESIHFPGEDDDIKLPFLNLEVSHEKMDDGSTTVPPKKYFEEGCFFHQRTRTFHGSIVWAKEKEPTLKGSSRWDFLLQFSSDLRFVARGIIVKRREPVFEENEPRFPLDGRWKVTWKLVNDQEEIGHIEVKGNIIELGPFEYILNLRDKRQPCFEWPLGVTSADLQPIIQRALSGVDLIEHPNGPAVGSCIVWSTSDPDHPEIVWERETISVPPPPIVIRLGPGGQKIYQRLNATELTNGSVPVYNQQSIWGNTFCQGLKVGLASYHFKSLEEGAYISYEHPMCGQWPPLDDGSPVPSRVQFRNIAVDDARRTFRGTIKWTEDYGTSWQGMSKWIYDMHFDSEFTCIVSGTVRSLSIHGQEEEMSTFGLDLIYINAGVNDTFRELVVSN